MNNEKNTLKKLETITMSELYDIAYPPTAALVENLLYEGTYIFAGAPKTGKSFFMSQLAYSVSTGQSLFGNKVNKGCVLYLALEDTYARLQSRCVRMFDINVSENLHLSTQANSLSKGLEYQLTEFINEHPNTKLIVIDTLQKIRELTPDYNYGTDYDVITRLKKFGEQHHLCIILVHHTRKMDATDPFETISGTNGLLGAADGAFVLQSEKRSGNSSTLDVVGRDQVAQRIYLEFDRTRCLWKFVKSDKEPWREPPDPLLESIASFVRQQPLWKGSPTDLVTGLRVNNIAPNAITKKLNVCSNRLLDEYGIRYEHYRTNSGRYIILSLAENS